MRIHRPLATALLALLPLLAAGACSSTDAFKKVRLEIPAPKPVPVDDYQKLLVADFWVDSQVPGLDVNREIRDYLRGELERGLGTAAVLVETPFAAEPDFADAAAWRRPDPGDGRALLLAGKARLTQETRKALTEEAMKELDGPFEPEKKLVERRVVTLELTLVLLRAASGEALYRREFKETRSYDNIKQPAAFAFFELLQQAKQKFLRAVQGESRVQDRYLISDRGVTP
jgi:hypothetical protein